MHQPSTTSSWGTVRGALEATNCGKYGIVILFRSKNPQLLKTIEAAAQLSVHVVEHLLWSWDKRVELYNLNIPMCGNVESRPLRFTKALPYRWAKGYLYAVAAGGNFRVKEACVPPVDQDT